MQCLREVFSDKRFVCCAPTVLYNIYIYYGRSVHSLYIQPRWYIYLWSDRSAIDLPIILFIYTIYTTIACMRRVYISVHCNCVMFFLNSYMLLSQILNVSQKIYNIIYRVLYCMQRATVLPLRDPAINSLLKLEQV